MADIREYIGNEVSTANVNLLERKILKGFYALEGDIIKIRSLYDYLLVQAETTFGDNFTNNSLSAFCLQGIQTPSTFFHFCCRV